MDTVRYTLALLLVCLLPPVLLLWILIHPLVGFWRRLGPARSYALLLALVAAGALAIASQRDHLLGTDWGLRWPLAAAGALLLVLSGWMRLRLGGHFGPRLLVGLPELAPDRFPAELVSSGLHARLRHPRYLQFTLACAGWALVANFPALYGALGLWLIGLPLLVALEERELAARFGPAWDEYRRRVPAFLPRPRGVK